MDMIDSYGEFLDEFLEPFYEAWQADPEAAWAILEAFERGDLGGGCGTGVQGDYGAARTGRFFGLGALGMGSERSALSRPRPGPYTRLDAASNLSLAFNSTRGLDPPAKGQKDKGKRKKG